MGTGFRAMAILEPVSSGLKASPAVAFAYGSVLASVGRKDEAKEVFDSLDAGRLSLQENDWIRDPLR